MSRPDYTPGKIRWLLREYEDLAADIWPDDDYRAPSPFARGQRAFESKAPGRLIGVRADLYNAAMRLDRFERQVVAAYSEKRSGHTIEGAARVLGRRTADVHAAFTRAKEQMALSLGWIRPKE